MLGDDFFIVIFEGGVAATSLSVWRIIVRFGETGGAHNLGSEYTGHPIYRSVVEFQHLIDSLVINLQYAAIQ